MSQFTTVNLTGERVLVKGADAFGTTGEVVLDARQWNEIKQIKDLRSAEDGFNAEVDRFFAPLMQAAEKFEAAAKSSHDDPIAEFVFEEGTEGTAGTPRHAIRLTPDSIVLRLIEQGDTDRLVWVAERLEVLEVLPGTGGRGVPSQRGPEPHEGPAASDGEDGWTSTEGNRS